MLNARALTLHCFYVFRLGAVRLRRGSVLRSLCVAAAKFASKRYRDKLPELLAEVRPLDMRGISFTPVNSMVLDAVYWLGVQGYEGIVAKTWIDLCTDAHAILEIGGNIGLFTVIGGRATSGRYTVLEPVPEVAAILRGNLQRNGIAGKVVVREAAAIPGVAACEVSLNIPIEGRDAPVGAHLVEGVEVAGRSSERVLRVPGLPFTTLVAGRDLIKIDAEGIEAELLEAAREAILAHRPAIMVEVLPEAIRLGELIASLARAGAYTISIIPEYGSETVVTVLPEQFSSALPARYKSKDVLLRPGTKMA